MRKYIYIFLICMLAACSQKNDPQAEELQRRIIDASKSGAAAIKIRTLTNFDWDEVCHLARSDDSLEPPSIDRYIADRGLKGYAPSYLPRKESYETALVFSKNNSVVKIIRMPSFGTNVLIDDHSSMECINSEYASLAFEIRILAGQKHLAIIFKRQED